MSPPTTPNEELLLRATSALRSVLDPEVGINIVDLGLVYGIDVTDRGLHVRLTMTTPTCPLSEQIALEAEQALRDLEGVDDVKVELVWDPPWSVERMAPVAKQALGWAP